LFYDAPVIGLILGILGIVFGKSSLNGAKSVGQSNGLAIAGIVCSSIVVGFYVIVIAWALLILGVIF
jgi:ABC-type transporter Mla maintaining outer membrane lipid asymmetry permease subunit MlaE